ncbi:PRC-barrel domain-containing protein [Hyphomicrobium sp. NDB2Meth4]|uniref:PRC-barrel domain-containing protein n=1 Tax=Hyphomicrobium sp. NDB2Meth4 TaxID=1892846 RepID=UPI000931AAF1|nr:PRC-barrel domain-containing protein [Hyphomicrobium sp. NDB2Meth4]
MTSRIILAATLALGTAGAALADVKVNTPGARVDTPAGPVDINVDVGSSMKPTEAWIGRAVYSSDGKNVGEVAAISGDSVYVDVGGFLGIGESRVLLDNGNLEAVQPDRITLKMTEAEVKSLPPTNAEKN